MHELINQLKEKIDTNTSDITEIVSSLSNATHAPADEPATEKSHKMNERDFVHWLQGFLELREDEEGLTARQVRVIQDHISLVFKKITLSTFTATNDFKDCSVFGTEAQIKSDLDLILDLPTHLTC